MNKDLKFYLDELKSKECFCGRKKKSMFSFCYKCYSALPKDLKRDLYLSIRHGYEDAYDKAVEWLGD